MPCMPPSRPCKHRRERLVTETSTYGIWQCVRCDRRIARGTPQLSLFSLGEAQQLHGVQDELPIPT